MYRILWFVIVGWFCLLAYQSRYAEAGGVCDFKANKAQMSRIYRDYCRKRGGPRRSRIPRPYRKISPYPVRWWSACHTFGVTSQQCYAVWKTPSTESLRALLEEMLTWLGQELTNASENACRTIEQRRHYYFLVKKPRRIPRAYRFSSRPWWWDRYRGPQNKQYQMLDAADRLMQKHIHHLSEQHYEDVLYRWSKFFYHRALPMETEVAMVSRLSRWLQLRPHPRLAATITQQMQRIMLTHRVCPWWYLVFMGTYAPKALQQLGPQLSEAWCELRHDFNKTRFLSWAQVERTIQQWSRDVRYRRILRAKRIGCSAEGRSIWAYRLGYPTRNKHIPTAVLVGNQHGDEHLGADLLLHWTEHFLHRYIQGDKTIREWLKTRHFWVIPVLNPDGKVFDMLGGVFKWWRFNRGVQHDGQIGVDLNRNFSYQWRAFTYSRYKPFDLPGTHPFSEPETNALRRHIRSIRKLTAVLDVHQSGSVLLTPYAHQWNRMPEPYDSAYQRIGKYLTEHNRYRVLQARKLYPHAGTLGDWGFVRHQALSLVLELGRAKYLTAEKKSEVMRENRELLERFADLAADPFQRIEQIWQQQRALQVAQPPHSTHTDN